MDENIENFYLFLKKILYLCAVIITVSSESFCVVANVLNERYGASKAGYLTKSICFMYFLMIVIFSQNQI